MRRIMIVCVTLFTAAATAAWSQTQTAPASPLDGTTWSVKVMPDAEATKLGEKAFDDVLMFMGGKVAMSECLKYGFGASNYSAMKAGDTWSFMTSQSSEKGGKAVWTGDFKDDSVKGKFTWTKKDGTVLNYAFEGKKAGK